MKISTYLTIFCIFLLILSAKSQNRFGKFESRSIFNQKYIQEEEPENLRIHRKGEKAWSLYYYQPLDWSNLNEDIIDDSNFVSDKQHRVTERFIPNFKYYISDYTNMVFGIYLKRSRTKYQGDIDTSLTQTNILTEKSVFTQNGAYGRIGFEHHLSNPKFRLFDLDFYFGEAMSFGLAPIKTKTKTDFIGGDYRYVNEKANLFGIGLDLYAGVNFQFDNISLGLEVIALGFDANYGIGKKKYSIEEKTGSKTTTIEYSTLDSKNGYFYSKLKNSASQSAMYRGLRFNISYYF